jgi:hypothetical protein
MKPIALGAIVLLVLVAAVGAQPASAPAGAASPRSVVGKDKQDKDAKKKDATPALDATAVAGKWHMSVGAPGFTSRSVLEFTVDPKDKDKKKLTGMLTETQVGDLSFKGEYSKGKLKFTIMIDVGNFPLEIDFQGKLQDDGTLAGTADIGPVGTVEWTAKRIDSL